MPKVERYCRPESGCGPLLVRPGWQITQLNYAPEFAFSAIQHLERHKTAERFFIPLRGNSVLVTSLEEAGPGSIETCPIEQGMVYGIPAGVWYAIAMRPGGVILILQDSATQSGEVELRPL